MSRSPNILLFIPHDLGDFLGCYGHEAVPSPNIDRLAQEGVRFNNCFTVCPECTCSRGGLMTGYQPHQNGLVGLSPFGWKLSKPHLAERLAQLGYQTHLFGFQHETHEDPRALGYADVHSTDSKQVGNVCRCVEQFIRAPENDGGSPPWFAYAGFHHVHRDWPKETGFGTNDVAVPSFLPDTEIIRKELAHFYQAIQDMDAAIGSVLQTLSETGKDRDTLVIFTTDHGAAFPGAKATFYDPGIHVPLVMRLPGQFEGGRTCDELVSNIDFTPTLLDMAGGEVPADMPGKSFLPLLHGESSVPREYVAGSMFYDVAYDPAHYIRTKTHKYIRSFAVDPEENANAPQAGLASFVGGRWCRLDDFDVLASPSWRHWPLPVTPPEKEELYDLRTDPQERNNLAAQPEAATDLELMRGFLQEMMTETASPLRHGHIPPHEKQIQVAERYKYGGERYQQQAAKREEMLRW